MKKMKLILALLTGLALVGVTSNVLAADANAKEVTITGSMVCGKCTLHETKKCQKGWQAEKDGKKVNYYLTENKVSKDAHEPICGGTSEKVTVTGTVEEKDGKEMMTPTKIEVVKS